MASGDRRISRRKPREIPALLCTADGIDSGFQRGRIEDVGGGGFRLRSPSPLLVNQRLRVYPWGVGDGVPASVVWTQSTSMLPRSDRFSSPVMAGCKFDRARDRDFFEEPERPGAARALRRSLGLLKWAVVGLVAGIALLLVALLLSTIFGR